MIIEVVDRTALSLHAALGITEERSDQLCDVLTWLSRERLTLAEMVAKIAGYCESNAELAFVCYTHGRWMERTHQFENN